MCSLFFCVADILNFLAKYWKLEIERQCRDIPNDMFCDVCESLGARYQRCLDNNGHQFEHLRT